MVFSPRIKLGPLADLCQRLATALHAGIDLRTVLAREAERASSTTKRRLSAVSEAVKRGETLAEALAAAGDFFPDLFRDLAEVGEQTGHHAEVFAQLAEHYRGQLSLRRTFLGTIAWPMIQLGLAVLIIGVLIWVMGMIEKMTGTKIDPLGLGLIGNRGLAIYVAFLACVGVPLLLFGKAAQRGLVWVRPIQRVVLRLPWIGRQLQTVALARLAWSMHLTMNAGMEVRRALRISLRSTRNARYTDQIDRIDAAIAEGNSIYEAFYMSGVCPADFLDTLAVGEQSGKIVESMGQLSRQYDQQARSALTTLTMLSGVAVWIVIGAISVALIFRLFMFYIGTIYNAMEPF